MSNTALYVKPKELEHDANAELLCYVRKFGDMWEVVDAKTAEIVVEKPTYSQAMTAMFEWLTSHHGK